MRKPIRLDPRCRAVVAIPACNEVERIGDCLASLAVQHDRAGCPIEPGHFAVLVLANNCSDETVRVAEALRASLPFPLILIERTFAPAHSNAGWARKTAMDWAADALDGRADGVVITTDADSSVAGTWLSNTLAAIDRGADAVAGYIEAQPRELLRLGPAFLQRGRLEDTYLSALAEIASRCDPIPHDPWPNHRVASGASFAVTVKAYRAIGGLPPKPVGEDAALSRALSDAGFKIRHAIDVSVITSCRLDGRAQGGAADTMRFRHDHPEAVCDAEIEPARLATRRSLWKGRLRRSVGPETLGGCDDAWWRKLDIDRARAAELWASTRSFEPFWRTVEAESALLRHTQLMRPSDLPREIERARAILRLLAKKAVPPGKIGRDPAQAPIDIRRDRADQTIRLPPQSLFDGSKSEPWAC